MDGSRTCECHSPIERSSIERSAIERSATKRSPAILAAPKCSYSQPQRLKHHGASAVTQATNHVVSAKPQLRPVSAQSANLDSTLCAADLRRRI